MDSSEDSSGYIIECTAFEDQLFEAPNESEQTKEQQRHEFAKKVARFQRSNDEEDQLTKGNFPIA